MDSCGFALIADALTSEPIEARKTRFFDQVRGEAKISGREIDMDAGDAQGSIGSILNKGRIWQDLVDQYYRALVEDCVPIGHAVNPNIAVLATMHCHRDPDVARENGKHLRFFGFSIAKYYLNGVVQPGRGNSWDEFLEMRDQLPDMGDSPTSAIGTPEEIRVHMRVLQGAGVDQVILLHQGGKLEHEANLESLKLFADEVMPEFMVGEDRREAEKAEQLTPAIEAALARKKWMPLPDQIPVVAAYGHFSHMPTKEDVALETSAATAGALGISATER